MVRCAVAAYAALRCAVMCCAVRVVWFVGNSVCSGRWPLDPASACQRHGALLAWLCLPPPSLPFVALALALRVALHWDLDVGASAALHVCSTHAHTHACMLCLGWVRALKCGSEAGRWPPCRFASLRVASRGPDLVGTWVHAQYLAHAVGGHSRAQHSTAQHRSGSGGGGSSASLPEKKGGATTGRISIQLHCMIWIVGTSAEKKSVFRRSEGEVGEGGEKGGGVRMPCSATRCPRS
jgi:hypothetical protein